MSMPRHPTEGPQNEQGSDVGAVAGDAVEWGRSVAAALDSLVRTCRTAPATVTGLAPRALGLWQAAANPVLRLESDRIFMGEREVLVTADLEGRWVLLAFMAGLRTLAPGKDATEVELVQLAQILAELQPELASVHALRDWLWCDGAEGFDVTLDLGSADGLDEATLDVRKHQENLANERTIASGRLSSDAVAITSKLVDITSSRDEFQRGLDQFAKAVTTGKMALTGHEAERARTEWEDPTFWLDCQLMLAIRVPDLRCNQSIDRLAKSVLQLLRSAPTERALRTWTHLRGRTEPVARGLNEALERNGAGKVLACRLSEELEYLPEVAGLLSGEASPLSQEVATELLERCVGSPRAFRQLGELVQSVGPAQYFAHLYLGALSPTATVALGKLLGALGASKRLLQELLVQSPAPSGLRLATVMGVEFRRRYARMMPRLVVENPPADAVPFLESLFEDRTHDWPSEWGRILALPNNRELPPPIVRSLCACIARSTNGAPILAVLLRAPDISKDIRLAAARCLKSHPEVLAETLKRRVSDMLLPSDIRTLLADLRGSQKSEES